MTDNNLDPWVQFFKTILDMPVPDELLTQVKTDEEVVSKNKSIQWKIKGLVGKLTYRIFVKYGNPKIVADDVLIKSFSNNFSFKYSLALLESHLQLLLSRKTNFVGSKALSFAIKFISNSTKQAQTMEKLKPYVENILFDTVIPIMFITERDMNTFESDPIEYIRNQYDFTETLF
jgi:hypothetical protein